MKVKPAKLVWTIRSNLYCLLERGEKGRAARAGDKATIVISYVLILSREPRLTLTLSFSSDQYIMTRVHHCILFTVFLYCICILYRIFLFLVFIIIIIIIIILILIHFK